MIIRSLSAPPARRLSARLFRFLSWRSAFVALVMTMVTLAFSGCTQNLYYFPEYSFAGRPIPPSLLEYRVMVALETANSGELQILDALRDQRFNIENTITQFFISGYSGADPISIVSFPDELRGYVYSNVAPFAISLINYGKETSSGSAATLSSMSSSFAVSPDFIRLYSAQEETSTVFLFDASLGTSFNLNVPNAYRVAVNQGNTIALIMTRNSNNIYRIVKLNSNAPMPPGAVDCEPQILPVYCAVPVPGTFDRPQNVVFSLDGSSAYVLNCGLECGGGNNGGSGFSVIPQGALQLNNIPTSATYPAVVTATVSVPGGATAGILNGTTFYLSGQQLQPDGLFAGFLTSVPLSTLVPGTPVSIADGNHSKMLFADGPTASGVAESTLWIGAQNCANGERAAHFAAGVTDQTANYNCLTSVLLPSSGTPVASIVPAINQGNGSVTAVPVPYPNQNNNQFYYGSLTGLCWVQNQHKMYTAYGGQVHAFRTTDNSEINNQNITVAGTALDVTYMDATDDTSN